MCWELPLSSSQLSKKNNMTEDNKDLQIKALVTELNNIKKDFAIKLEEIQALYLEIKQQKSINEDHQKLNGRLRLELEELKLNKVQAVEDAKKESDELMMKVISKYENKIKELEFQITYESSNAMDDIINTASKGRGEIKGRLFRGTDTTKYNLLVGNTTKMGQYGDIEKATTGFYVTGNWSRNQNNVHEEQRITETTIAKLTSQ